MANKDLQRSGRIYRATGTVLTQRQTQFAENFATNGGIAVKAAIDAGYSPKSAKSIALENLTKPAVKAEIVKFQDKKRRSSGIQIQDIVDRLATMADTCERDSDKLRALELLGKYYSMFTDRIEQVGTGGQVTFNLIAPGKDSDDKQLPVVEAKVLPSSQESETPELACPDKKVGKNCEKK